MLEEQVPAYFLPIAPGRYRATEHTSGAWSKTEQHISPLAGLVVHEIERDAQARGSEGGWTISRVSFDILGVVGIVEFEIAVEVLRPGRTIELVEAVVTAHGRAVLRARAWRLATTDTGLVAGGAPASMPEDLPVWPMDGTWPGGYIASLDVRRDPASVPGRGSVWLDTDIALVHDHKVSDLASFVALVDTANGIVVRESPDEWLFPNVDLTIHLHRQPVAGPVGLDTSVTFGADGVGLTSTVLHDRLGAVGRAAQTLTIRRRA